jgi:hypothetical protein
MISLFKMDPFVKEVGFTIVEEPRQPARTLIEFITLAHASHVPCLITVGKSNHWRFRMNSILVQGLLGVWVTDDVVSSSAAIWFDLFRSRSHRTAGQRSASSLAPDSAHAAGSR